MSENAVRIQISPLSPYPDIPSGDTFPSSVTFHEYEELDGNNQIVFDYAGHEYKITVEKSAGNFNESIKRPLTEGFKTGERIQALATYLDIDPSEISNTYGDEFETPEGDYLVVDEDEAEQLARDDIENLFDELGLDSFTPDFRDWIIMNALDNDWFEDVKQSLADSASINNHD